MEQSESIKNLAAALHKAQGEIRIAIKDAANPFFKSKYADLQSVWDAVRPAFQANGLSLTQIPDMEGAQAVLVTVLMHESGEWQRGRYPINPVKQDPQAVGSAITYARRYALQAVAGVCADDDDDAEAGAGKGKVATRTGQQKAKKPTWTKEQLDRGGEIRARILDALSVDASDIADKELTNLLKVMAYDDPEDVLDAAQKLHDRWLDIHDQAQQEESK
jgi:hypothetical protein